jgi:membrane-bound inhibitor of C-type lysozyme
LALTQSASGAKYESDTSLSPGRKLTWWTKGEEAMLIEADSDDADGSSETIVKCQQTAT